ncbi:hypothetical protein [Streptomyces sp. FxanaA7]|uniref:hypothetical protein n=1 Tax=Streptomyces sp. FxanaA7 TaxID=1265492 RepID=UPI0005EEBDB2|nr:hypothetical protein [Streptomyces sp. FxanaA7]
MDHSATLGMCLLHADYHPMGGDCWAHTMDWYFAHPDLTDTERRDRYAIEVECAMLDKHILALKTPQPTTV